MKRNAVAVVQARLGSRRLPGKMLADIAGRPLLWHVVSRARRSERLRDVVVATTRTPADDALVAFCEAAGVRCYRGSEEDVLDRFYEAAIHVDAQVIVRLTGDCPMADPGVIDRVVNAFETSDCDYASNVGRLNETGHFIGRTFPDGLDTEVFSFAALERAWHEAALPSEREHVTPYLYKNPSIFRIRHVSHFTDHAHHRWTVDEPEDLTFVRRVFDLLYTPARPFTMDEVLDLLSRFPELSQINARFEVNEGYSKSLQKDRLVLFPGLQKLG